ncbi:uncharacterized protein METZ01_LOCUS107359, partial [marine metagenome]
MLVRFEQNTLHAIHNFYNQVQSVHSKGIISALGLFLGGYLLRLRG